jgi:hypothetical protein
MDHQSEIVIPEWQSKWTNVALAASPTPGRKRSEKSAIAKASKASNIEAAKSGRKKKRNGKELCNHCFASTGCFKMNEKFQRVCTG